MPRLRLRSKARRNAPVSMLRFLNLRREEREGKTGTGEVRAVLERSLSRWAEDGALGRHKDLVGEWCRQYGVAPPAGGA